MAGATRVRLLAPVGLLLAVPAIAVADGGVVRTRQSVGSLVVTVFTTPTPLAAGPADVSVMVQDRATLAPMLDARVHVFLTPEGGDREPGRAHPGPVGATHTPSTSTAATRARATNKLLYAAPVHLSRPGRWRLGVRVENAGEVEDVACVLRVGVPPPRLLAFWPELALPLLGVGLVALNRRLARAQRAAREHGRKPR